MSPRPNVLVAPLDWGLGHASRCVPVVEALLRHEVRPFLAGAGEALRLLGEAFPDLPLLELPAYDIHYAGVSLSLSLAAQSAKIISAAAAEHRRLDRWIGRYRLQAAISDNRFGCYSRRIPCAYITHQVHVRAPVPWMSPLARAAHRRIIRRYAACWIPDAPAPPGLAGALSHPPPKDVPYFYLGPLSRLKQVEAEARYELLCLLSGPEPARGRLETLILEQLPLPGNRALLVRGLPGRSEHSAPAPGLEVVDFLGGPALSEALAGSALVLCRSGYSTLMDLARLGKRAVLVPTPGQSEQKYLGELLWRRGLCLCMPQRALCLAEAIKAAKGYPGLGVIQLGNDGEALLSRAVKALLSFG